MCGLAVEDIRLVVCTHAHSDHYGQAGAIVQRTGCELWMHPKYEHMSSEQQDPEATLERRIEVARQSGVPEEPLRRYAAEREHHESGISAVIAPDRELLPGVVVNTDLGPWNVYETPGHAPSHVCLFQPERRLLISGDHLLGRISLFFDFGYSPTRSANSWRRWAWSNVSARACACRATGARSPTCAHTSTATASWSPSAWSRCAARSCPSR